MGGSDRRGSLSQTAGGMQLQFAQRDAIAFSAALASSGVPSANIRTITGPQATLQAVRAALGDWLARSVAQDDTVLIFFSGHGYVEPGLEESYLLFYDSDPQSVYATSLSIGELKHIFTSRVRSSRVLLFADALRPDFFQTNVRASSRFLNALDELAASHPSFSTVVASSQGEYSREGRQWGGHGLFSKHLVEGLRGKADANSDSAVTYDEVFNFVSAHVSAETSQRQRPWRTRKELADIKIARVSPVLAAARPGTVKATPKLSASSRPTPSRSTPRTRPVRRPPPRSARSKATPKRTEEAAATHASTETASSNTTATPAIAPPTPAAVPATGGGSNPGAPSPVASGSPGPAPSPLIPMLRVAIASGNLIEPGHGNAWELYQRLSAEPGAGDDLATLKPLLADALIKQGKSIAIGDIRADGIKNKIDEFQRASQLLGRARTLRSDEPSLAILERLCKAEISIALQFFDEAKSSLAQLQGARLAGVENAFGLIYLGELDEFQAERAFKRAIELDPAWAAPHYNLALIYRSNKRDEALAEFEQAARLDPGNAVILTAVGDEYFAREKWADSAEWYRKAIEASPLDSALRTKLGHALYSSGLREEANREYKKALELRSKQP